MLKFDYQESIIFWVVTTAHALERAANEELLPLGVTFRQAEALAWLVLEGSLSQAALAERMRIEAPTLAGIVERMERADWIVRETCKKDRRKKLLRPTDRVEPIWKSILEATLRVRTKASAGLAPPELQSLIHSLQQVQQNLAGRNGD